LSGVNESVMQVFKSTYFTEKIGEDHLYPTMERAIEAIHEETHRSGGEEICPLLTVCRIS
jgi:SulP family sulfate permease